MKGAYLLILFLACLLLTSAVPHGVFAGHPKPDADYVFVPEGMLGDTMQVSEFYISSIEVTNTQYREFINDLIVQNDTAALRVAKVDTVLWRDAGLTAWVSLYIQNPRYDLYPVVGVSRRGAELYCEWLTLRYHAGSKQKAHFSLPTEAQWTYAAKGGNPKAIYPWAGKTIEYGSKGKKRSQLHCNYAVGISTLATSVYNPDADITAPSRSYEPNTFGIYNMAGNVAEMLADRPYTKGGSWLSPADKVLISAHEDANLIRGATTIGFRPVMIRE